MTETKEEKKLPQKKATALKRNKQDEKKQLTNKILKSKVRTARNAFKKDVSESNFKKLQSLLDKGVKKKIFKKGKASRIKSRLVNKCKNTLQKEAV